MFHSHIVTHEHGGEKCMQDHANRKHPSRLPRTEPGEIKTTFASLSPQLANLAFTLVETMACSTGSLSSLPVAMDNG